MTMDSNRRHIIALYAISAFCLVRSCQAESQIEENARNSELFLGTWTSNAYDEANRARNSAEFALDRVDDLEGILIRESSRVRFKDCKTDYWGRRVCTIEKD